MLIASGCGPALTSDRPFLFGAATQVFGIERVAPVYYAYSIFARDATGVGRKVDPYAAMAVFPATVAGHVLPSILMTTLPLTATEVSRSYCSLQSIVCYAFYFSPITISLLTKGASTGIEWLKRKCNATSPAPVNETPKRRDAQLSSDLLALRFAYSMMFSFQSVWHLYGAAEVMRPLFEALTPFSWADRLALLKAGIGPVMSENTQGASFDSSPLALFTLSTLAFLLYTLWDLRRRGYITNREAGNTFLGLSAGSALVGSGAAYAGVWCWRERVLHRVTHRSKKKKDTVSRTEKESRG